MMHRNERFPTLSSLAGVARAFGWFLLSVGGLGSLIGFGLFAKAVSDGGSRTSFDVWSGVTRSGVDPETGVVVFLVGAAGAVIGFFLLMCAEGVGVAFAIEQNTRGGSEYLGDKATNLSIAEEPNDSETAKGESLADPRGESAS